VALELSSAELQQTVQPLTIPVTGSYYLVSLADCVCFLSLASFNPEEGIDMLLRNFTASQSSRQHSVEAVSSKCLSTIK
jgi:hypothetical protein